MGKIFGMGAPLFAVFVICSLFPSWLAAQQLVEAPVPQAFVTDKEGEEEVLAEGETYTGEAPLAVKFMANAQEYEDFSLVCTWTFTRKGEEASFLTRYDTQVDYSYDASGSYEVKLSVTYSSRTNANLVLDYEFEPFMITISESSLKLPNAFSPNGDGINDYFNVYDVKSIVVFNGAIYNRWGVQLFSWGIDQIGCSDCGWDGTYKGNPVKDGVYFVVINAIGADGIHYDMRGDVNILRGFTENAQ